MIRNWITLESFESLFPIRTITMCETKRMLGREERNLCHHLSMVTRWCSSTTVMLWSCSYATWRTDLAVGLFISLCVFCGGVCALWDSTPPMLNPSLLRVWLLTSARSHGYGALRLAQTWEHLLGEDEPCLFGALLQIFMCSWNWFHMSWGAACISRFSDQIKPRKRAKKAAVVLIFNWINRTWGREARESSVLVLTTVLLVKDSLTPSGKAGLQYSFLTSFSQIL